MRAIYGPTFGELQNREVATKMRDLRSSLDMTQSELARALGVSLTKVQTWEKGAQIRPPVDILLKMARLTQEKEQRHWFLQEAGVELDSLKADFCEEIAADGTSVNQESIATLPLFNRFRIKGNGSIAPQLFDAEQLQISRHLVRHPQSTVGVVVSSEVASVCRMLPLNNGDLLIVDRSRRFASEFLTGHDSAAPEIAAIVFPQLDLSMAFRSQVAAGHNATLKSNLRFQSRSGSDIDQDAASLSSPKVLFGNLSEQFTGANVEGNFSGNQVSRILFSVGQDEGISLTDWQPIGEVRKVDARPLSHHAEILGAVVGWIKMSPEVPGT